MKTITIGITETEARYENYPLWIKGNDPEIEIIKLSQGNFDEIKKCSGVVLSGGIDTHPQFYNNARINYPLAPEKFHIERDEFELKVFEYSRQNNIPVLGICRGMQLINIALGGNLIQDIEEVNPPSGLPTGRMDVGEAGKPNHRRTGLIDGKHEITVDKNSLLYQIIGIEIGTINSAHHQGLGTIADELKAVAYSPDGIIEATEWKDKNNKSFLLCVQWHPERLAQADPENPFTKKIREQFIESIKKNKK